MLLSGLDILDGDRAVRTGFLSITTTARMRGTGHLNWKGSNGC